MDRNFWGLSAAIFEKSTREDWEEALACGFQAAELTVNTGVCTLSAKEWISQAEARLQGIREAGVQLWTVHIPYGEMWNPSEANSNLRKENCIHIGEVLKAASHWGARGAVLHGSYEPVSTDPAERDVQLKFLEESMAQLNKEASSLGLFLALENLPRTCLGNCSREMAQATAGGAAICFDVNHLLQEDHSAFLKAVGDRIRTVHLSDYDFLDECHWLPGDGKIQWPELLDGLEAVGYDGPLLFEISCRRLPGIGPRAVAFKFRAVTKS